MDKAAGGNIFGGGTAPALTVSQLTARLREVLEGTFRSVRVAGEIANWTAAPSGHCYFTLKDSGAIISCVMWKASRAGLAFRPEDGQQVEARGRLSVYEKRGQYQLTVDAMTLAGQGLLWQKFLDLKAKLESEGLFDESRKRPLPMYPRRVGIVTAPTGAAIRDMLSVLGRRAPAVDVLIYPARVQGIGAAAEIARGIRRLAESGTVDVIIAGRGGGSMEDLWEFNNEALARTIAACPVPVVSAVGHEVDFTIADFVADLRAPTPSAAAELVSRAYADLQDRLQIMLRRHERAALGGLREARRRVEGMMASHALRRPMMELREAQQRVDTALARMPRLLAERVERMRLRLGRATGALEGHNPDLILAKGYAIVRRARDGAVLTRVDALKKNLPIDIALADGQRRAIVTEDAADDLFM